MYTHAADAAVMVVVAEDATVTKAVAMDTMVSADVERVKAIAVAAATNSSQDEDSCRHIELQHGGIPQGIPPTSCQLCRECRWS